MVWIFRKIFTLPKLRQKELTHNSTEFIEHGRADMKILFMMVQQEVDRTSARATL